MEHIDTQLMNACLANGERIVGLTHNGQRVHGGRLLLAISGCESAFGRQRLYVRAEPGYSAPDGHYYKSSRTVRDRWKTYGVLAASSYGSFQIMYITANEMGFIGHPIDLQKDEICAYWATQLITERFIKRQGCKTLSQVLDAYNSGNARDHLVPTKYIDKGIDLYDNLESV
jgi:hypothetical protein